MQTSIPDFHEGIPSHPHGAAHGFLEVDQILTSEDGEEGGNGDFCSGAEAEWSLPTEEERPPVLTAEEVSSTFDALLAEADSSEK